MKRFLLFYWDYYGVGGMETYFADYDSELEALEAYVLHTKLDFDGYDWMHDKIEVLDHQEGTVHTITTRESLKEVIESERLKQQVQDILDAPCTGSITR